VSYGVVLGAMSAQAHYLGHHTQALHLAEAAVAEISPKAGPITVAFMRGQLAVARACVGERGGAFADLRSAERRLDRANPSSDVIGPYQPASLDHQRAEVLLALGDRRGAISALTTALRQRSAAERRSRTVTLAWLAGVHLDRGHLELAVETWHRFLDDYPYLRSGWADAALATLRARVRPHGGNAAAWTLWRRAAAMLEQEEPDPQ
jgi:tetratricopeptide (TPR) repeat protein